MKILKIIAITLASVIAIALLVALFVKSDYSVERRVTILQPKQVVFDYVKLLKNQSNFSVWARMDTAMQKGFEGTDGTVGAKSSWKSQKKEVGSGEQTITQIDKGARIDYELHFIEPFESKDKAYITTQSVGDSATTVAWGFEGKMNYPMNLMLLFMDMENMLGKDLQGGLNNLKTILEKK